MIPSRHASDHHAQCGEISQGDSVVPALLGARHTGRCRRAGETAVDV